jgi:hypothetical protein
MNILKSRTPLKSITKMIGVFLEPDLYEFLNKICKDEDKSKNFKINEVIRDFKNSNT